MILSERLIQEISENSSHIFIIFIVFNFALLSSTTKTAGSINLEIIAEFGITTIQFFLCFSSSFLSLFFIKICTISHTEIFLLLLLTKISILYFLVNKSADFEILEIFHSILFSNQFIFNSNLSQIFIFS